MLTKAASMADGRGHRFAELTQALDVEHDHLAHHALTLLAGGTDGEAG
jgi:hypothetical protein